MPPCLGWTSSSALAGYLAYYAVPLMTTLSNGAAILLDFLDPETSAIFLYFNATPVMSFAGMAFGFTVSVLPPVHLVKLLN